MSDILEVYDPISNRIRKIKDMRLQSYDIPDKKGGKVSTNGVEFTVIGANHDWPLWLPCPEFLEANPHINIDDIRT